MIKDFKEFAFKGNPIDMAVGVIIKKVMGAMKKNGAVHSHVANTSNQTMRIANTTLVVFLFLSLFIFAIASAQSGAWTKKENSISGTWEIVVGHGARFDMERITDFAEKLRIPVVTTLFGEIGRTKGLLHEAVNEKILTLVVEPVSVTETLKTRGGQRILYADPEKITVE